MYSLSSPVNSVPFLPQFNRSLPVSSRVLVYISQLPHHLLLYPYENPWLCPAWCMCQIAFFSKWDDWLPHELSGILLSIWNVTLGMSTYWSKTWAVFAHAVILSGLVQSVVAKTHAICVIQRIHSQLWFGPGVTATYSWRREREQRDGLLPRAHCHKWQTPKHPSSGFITSYFSQSICRIFFTSDQTK